MKDDFQNKIRYHINSYIFDNGFAPTTLELSKIMNANINEVEQSLRSLADNHALVLHPNSFDIWIAHPFALFPTLFWIKTKNKQWWGNCTWCSLGIASMTNADTDIFTKLQGQEESLTIHIRCNKVVEENYVVHFPQPVKKAWDNVIHFCANTLIFKTETPELAEEIFMKVGLTSDFWKMK